MSRFFQHRFTWTALAAVDTMIFVGRGHPVLATIYLAIAIASLVSGVARAVEARP